MPTETIPVTREDTKLAPLHKVLLHNDDVTPMDFVVRVLVDVFKLEIPKAIEIMLEAHHGGVALVVVEPLERAEFHVEQARSLARPRRYPLSFSIEPDS